MIKLKVFWIGCALLSCTLVFGQKSMDSSTPTTTTTSELLEVYIPNAFTPNMDGHNDYFKPVISGGEIDFYELSIISRTGQVVFFSKDPSEVWNGSVKGSSYVSSPSIFLYYLKVKSVSSLKYQEFKGHIVMVR